MSSIDLALSFMSSVAAAPSASPVAVVKVVRAPRKSPATTDKPRMMRAPVVNPVAFLTPAEFLAADRAAKGNVEAERAAIASFVGYLAGEPHGTQIDVARLTAQTAIRRANGEILARREKSAPTIAGYVAGAAGFNRAAEKRMADLKARHRLAVGASLDLAKCATSPALAGCLMALGREDESVAARRLDDSQAAALGEALASLEAARAAELAADIAKL